jgi:hypothetical protein
MSYYSEDILDFAFIAKSQPVSLQPAVGVVVTRANLPLGTAVVTDLENKVLATMPTTSTKFKIAYKAPNNDIIWTAPIVGSDVVVSNKVYSPETEQVTFVGYPGTGSSTVPSAASTSYHIMVRRTENSKLRRGVGYDNDITAQYTTAGTTSAQAWTTNMVATLIKTTDQYETELSNEYPGYVRIEAVSDGTVTAFTGTGTAVRVTKNSTTVEFLVATTWAASTGTVAAGDVIQLPTSGAKRFSFTALDAITHDIWIGTDFYTVADAASANDGSDNAAAIVAAVNAGSNGEYSAYVSGTAGVVIAFNPCFSALVPVVFDQTNNAEIVVTIDAAPVQDSVPVRYVVKDSVTAGATFELTYPYQGETGVVIDGTGATNSGVVSTITAWGIKFAGIRNQYDVNRFRDFYKNTFEVRVMRGPNPDPVAITTTVKPSLGSGNPPQVMQSEYVSYGNFGRNRMVTDIPQRIRPQLATDCGRYSLVQLRVKKTSTPELVGGLGVFKNNFYFWLELPASGLLASGSQGDLLLNTLDASLATGGLDYVAV